jgi:CubicO group peptidase (beta-lactamase class C family)
MRSSNLGYGILEHIIARASGTSYEEYLRREIFAPLRLEWVLR